MVRSSYIVYHEIDVLVTSGFYIVYNAFKDRQLFKLHLPLFAAGAQDEQ